ncbi:MAG: hypothetical protein JO270_16655 [Acidobacteriaceae bacterium]|nr:hypothetical protein [Acidobacteriaceae bacterium]MBV8572180.1 hypothetical protein [Acidobacteriaceae bacterium]
MNYPHITASDAGLKRPRGLKPALPVDIHLSRHLTKRKRAFDLRENAAPFSRPESGGGGGGLVLSAEGIDEAIEFRPMFGSRDANPAQRIGQRTVNQFLKL